MTNCATVSLSNTDLARDKNRLNDDITRLSGLVDQMQDEARDTVAPLNRTESRHTPTVAELVD